jgi:two-component system response regulator BaeR
MTQLLLVDDNLFVGEALTDYLQWAGYDVYYTTSGMAALEAAKQVPFCLVVSDLKMPGMDGGTLCQELRRLYKMPMILMSGYLDEEDALKMAAAGFTDVLPKPFLPEALESRIRTVLAQDGP